jgi:cardiolipin synthase
LFDQLDWPLISAVSSVLLLAIDVYCIGVAVYRTHGVERTLAWVFAILALPGVGALAYFLLAQPSIRRTTRRRRRAWASVRGATAQRSSASLCGEKHLGQEPSASLLHLVQKLTGLAPTGGNKVELLADDERAFARIESALQNARQFIWAEYYLIRNDETGHRFLDLLVEKARQGVEVLLLYDALGSLGLDGKRLKAIRDAGGAAEAFLPLNPLGRRWSVHLRNHRKMIIVDGEIGFTGGMNVGDEYSGRARRRGKRHFHDSHLAVYGPAVGDLEQVFAEDWTFATEEVLTLHAPLAAAAPAGSSVVAVVPSGPDQDQNASNLVYFAGIASAQSRIWLTTPYFIPDEPLMQALQSAALRGLDVGLLVPEQNDVALVAAAARSYFPRLVKIGVRVYQYRPSILHAKVMVVDGCWGIVGSSNVDIRSFRLNFELSALVVDAAFARELESRFLADLQDSHEVTLESLARYGTLARWRDSAARLLSPLL